MVCVCVSSNLPHQAIFIFVNEELPPTAALMSAIYNEHKDEDGFLYVTCEWSVGYNTDAAHTHARLRREHIWILIDTIITTTKSAAAY